MAEFMIRGVKVDIYTILDDETVVFTIDEGTDFTYGSLWMNKQECQQLIEQLMLVCERLQE